MKGSEPSNNPSASKPTARASATMRNRGSPAQTFKRSPSLMASPRRAIPEIAQPLAPFDHAEISDAYNKKDVEYEESARQLCEATCEMLVEMHEWMVGRADMEGVQASAALKDEVDALVQREEEQELLCHRMLEFVTRMQNALAALTGVSRGLV